MIQYCKLHLAMKLRIKTYLSSPWGIWYRLKRDFPFWIRGKSYYTETAKLLPKATHVRRIDNQAINSYLANKKTRKASSVIYTCITNGYDDIREIACPGYINPDWDYICFTDDAEDIAAGHIGIWEIKPLAFNQLDNTRNNRWHKMHPHVLFPEYNESIYIDANIDILSPYLFNAIRDIGMPFILPRHPTRNCIYQEFDFVLSEFLDNPRKILQERRLVSSSGMPKNYGLTENGILYRRHNEPSVIAMMREWWEMIEKYSRRDQLSLAWLLWKNGMQISDISIPNARFLANDFCVFPHRRKT